MKKMRFSFYFLNCFIAAFSSFLCIHGQDKTECIDIAKIKFAMPLANISFFQTSDAPIADEEIKNLSFSQKILPEFTNSLPLKMAGKIFYLKFNVCNNSNSPQQSYFFPGFYFTDMEIFKRTNNMPGENSYAPLKNLTDKNSTKWLIPISLSQGEHATFFVKMLPLKSGISSLSPQIVNKDFAGYFTSSLSNKPINRITYMVSGILLMMIFYSLAIYLQNSKTEFICYSGYAFFTGALLFLKSYLHNYGADINYHFEGYFDFILQAIGFLFYIAFIRKFLDTKNEYPVLEKAFRLSQLLTILLLFIFSFTYFFLNNYLLPGIIENTTKLLLVVLSIFFIVTGLQKNKKLLNYLVAGQIMLLAFSFISLVLIITPMDIRKYIWNNTVFNDPMLYYEIAIVLELAFFLSALAYKNKRDIMNKAKESERLRLDNERNEFERQIAIVEAKSDERNRISTDMHDELGSGVTAIRLMSEIVKMKTQHEPLPEIEKISSSANELLEKMNEIIWTMQSSNDTLESLIAYLREQAVSFFENTCIGCVFKMPASIPSIEISGEKRRNIYLSVKEALNNIVKHAGASKVEITIEIKEKLLIGIRDNGKGIDLQNLRTFGNGITNIKKRIKNIESTLYIRNDNGTSLLFEIKI